MAAHKFIPLCGATGLLGSPAPLIHVHLLMKVNMGAVCPVSWMKCVSNRKCHVALCSDEGCEKVVRRTCCTAE